MVTLHKDEQLHFGWEQSPMSNCKPTEWFFWRKNQNTNISKHVSDAHENSKWRNNQEQHF